MQIIAVTTLAVLAGVAAQAGETYQSAERRVTVCMEMGGAFKVAAQAQSIASRMFSGIGVTVDWRHRCPADGLLISFSACTPADQLPRALAYALPYEGTHIVILYDRVLQAPPTLRPRLLAHVLVHEITYILQALAWHSNEGAMKAHWDASDVSAMRRQLLPFAPEDIGLIYRGLALRAARDAARETATPTTQ